MKSHMEKYEKMFCFICWLEKFYPVQSWKIDGVDVWPIIRTSINYMNVVNSSSLKGNKRGGFLTKSLQKIKNIFNLIYTYVRLKYLKLKDRDNNDCIKKTDILFLTLDFYRTYKSDSGFYDVHVYPLIEKLKYKCCVLEATVTGRYKLPRDGKSIMIQDGLLWEAIKRRMQRRCGLLKPQDVVLPQFGEVMRELESNGFLCEFAKNQQELLRQMDSFMGWVVFFEKILTKSNPKKVITVFYYHGIGFALQYAANQQKITTADLQHGIIHGKHIAYSNWDMPYDGYNVMPKFFLSWWLESAQIINSWAKNTNEKYKAIHIGQVWADMWAENNRFTKRYMDIVRRYKKTNKVYILYSMQTNHNIPANVVQIMNNSSPNWEWFIRLHPSQQPNLCQYKELFEKKNYRNNINIEEATYYPLHVIMQFIALHITETSTVSLECAFLGIPSIVFDDKNLRGTYDCFLDSGVIKQIDASSMTIDDIKKQMKKNSAKIESNKSEFDVFFE